MTIGAFYQCWKHPAATIQVIRQFRTFYPDATIYLVSDNGYDYTELAKQYNCIYEHSTLSANCALFSSIDQVRVWLERLTRAINEIKEDWCMLLEDDLYIEGKYDENLLQAELNGYKEGNYLRKSTEMFIKLFNPTTKSPLNHGGFGGCVLNVPFYKYILNKNPIKYLQFMWEHTGELSNKGHTIYGNRYITWGEAEARNTDTILSILCYIFGGSIGAFVEVRQLTDCNPHALVIHNFKKLYNQPVEEKDKHLVKIT